MAQTVLITGASSGIGRVTAKLLSMKGYHVYGTSRTAQNEYTAGENGGFITMLALDVNDTSSIAQAISIVLEREGRIDVLINNAGNGIAGALELTDPSEAQAQLSTNFFGAINMTNTVLPIMREQGGGRVVCISSLAAQIPIPFQSLYSASKAALEITMQAMAMETTPFGVLFTCLELGDTKTGFTKNRKYIERTRSDTIYTTRFKKSIGKMEQDEQGGMEPIEAAKAVAKLLARKNPPLLSVCGGGAKAVYVIRKLLPLRWSNFMISKLYS